MKNLKVLNINLIDDIIPESLQEVLNSLDNLEKLCINFPFINYNLVINPKHIPKEFINNLYSYVFFSEGVQLDDANVLKKLLAEYYLRLDKAIAEITTLREKQHYRIDDDGHVIGIYIDSYFYEDWRDWKPKLGSLFTDISLLKHLKEIYLPPSFYKDLPTEFNNIKKQ